MVELVQGLKADLNRSNDSLSKAQEACNNETKRRAAVEEERDKALGRQEELIQELDSSNLAKTQAEGSLEQMKAEIKEERRRAAENQEAMKGLLTEAYEKQEDSEKQARHYEKQAHHLSHRVKQMQGTLAREVEKGVAEKLKETEGWAANKPLKSTA